MGIKKLNLKYIDNINSFTDFPDTPEVFENDKLLKINSDGTAIEFSGDSSNLNDETVDDEEYKLDYITGFDMESFSPDINGYHEKIRINKGFVEIAEPGDLSSNNFWNQNSKMIANYPLRNGQTRDISGHKNNGYALQHRRYGSVYPNDVYWKKDGDSIHYYTETGTTNDFLTTPLYSRDEFPILDNSKIAFSCWVKYTENITDFRYIFSDYVYNGSYDGRVFNFGQNGMNHLSFYIWDGNSNGNFARYEITPDTTLQIGQWYHFFVQFDSNDLSNTFEFYIDNILQTDLVIERDTRTNTELAYDVDSWLSINSLFYSSGNYINLGLYKSYIYFNRLLTETERNYLYNNVYVVRGLNTTPNSDIYELPNDVEIDTQNLSASDFLDDTYTATLEDRWYYIYAQPSSTSGQCEIKLSARQPIRNRFNVEREDYREESLYHPYLNARCVGIFKYGKLNQETSSGMKVIRFKMVKGYFQFSEGYEFTRSTNSYGILTNSFSKILPTNINSMILRVYYNALISVVGGLNRYALYNRQIQRPEGSDRALFYKVQKYDLMNMSEDIYWRQWVLESSYNRVYLSIYGFNFTQ